MRSLPGRKALQEGFLRDAGGLGDFCHAASVGDVVQCGGEWPGVVRLQAQDVGSEVAGDDVLTNGIQNMHNKNTHLKQVAMAQSQDAVTINIRAKAGQRDLIDQAADRLGRSRSDFMLEAACRRAEDVLLDQTYFALDSERMAAFQAVLDKPPEPTDRLRRLLHARAPWDAER